MFLPAFMVAAASPCAAAEGTQSAYAWREIAAGADVTASAWSVYTTATVAPIGSLNDDGPRLRATGGYGRYQYLAAPQPVRFRGVQSFSEFMLGYQMQLGPATVKGFAGAAGIGHAVTPFDRTNTVSGLEIGFKAALEAWFEISDRVWASADLSWTAAHDTYASRLRLGWRLTPSLSLGLEAGAVGNATYDGGRGGAFARYTQDWGEVSLSAGLSGDIDRPDAPYVTVNWLFRY